MDRQEAIQMLSKVGKISVSYAEDLYDSFFPKPVVPQYVADWIEYCKFTNVNLVRALFISDIDFYNYGSQEDCSKLKEFLGTETNQEIFARAWLDGYEVESEPRYTVEFKGIDDNYKEMPYNHGIFIDTVKLSRRWLLGSISRLEEPTYDGIPALIDKINEWADSRGLKQADSKIQWMRITEEVGEIRDVLLKPTKFTEPQAALKDAIGDTLVTIIVLAHQLDLDVTECLSIAYEEIKNRKGKMVNGTFVKKEDL